VQQARFTADTINRKLKSGNTVYQVRFWAQGLPNPLLSRALGEQFRTKTQADREAGRLLAEFRPELLRRYQAKMVGLEERLAP
jgi:hypothetical protein